MYVYIRAKGEQLYVVGFFDPQGQWQSESDHASREEAAKRVRWLNGGREGGEECMKEKGRPLQEGSSVRYVASYHGPHCRR